MTLRECMSTDTFVVDADSELAAVYERMKLYGVREMPVVEGDRRYLGIVRLRDVKTAIGHRDSPTLRQLVVTETPTVLDDAPVYETWQFITRYPAITVVPVLTSEGQLAGAVTQHSLLRVLAGLPPQSPTPERSEMPLLEALMAEESAPRRARPSAGGDLVSGALFDDPFWFGGLPLNQGAMAPGRHVPDPARWPGGPRQSGAEPPPI